MGRECVWQVGCTGRQSLCPPGVSSILGGVRHGATQARQPRRASYTHALLLHCRPVTSRMNGTPLPPPAPPPPAPRIMLAGTRQTLAMVIGPALTAAREPTAPTAKCENGDRFAARWQGHDYSIRALRGCEPRCNRGRDASWSGRGGHNAGSDRWHIRRRGQWRLGRLEARHRWDRGAGRRVGIAVAERHLPHPPGPRAPGLSRSAAEPRI